MRWSQTFISTLKERPQEAEIESHALMIRAGLIQKLASGLYIYLPLCLRVFEKVARIIREELGRAGAIEVLMPALQPKEIWEESGRWGKLGDLMMKVKDREDRVFVLGPTHEEIITHLVSRKINSYRDLPRNFYQIQTKFRDEIRPRFGLMRAREFIMKDGYSFNLGAEDLHKSYVDMYNAYGRIFSRCGLKTAAVLADTGVMGGNESHEFMVLSAGAGEDKIAQCPGCGYASNVELAARKMREPKDKGQTDPCQEVATPGKKSVEEVAEFLKVRPNKLIKTLVYMRADGRFCVVLIRGDREVQETKLIRELRRVGLLGETERVELADEKTVERATGAPLGFAGPVGKEKDGEFMAQLVADCSVMKMQEAVTGANKADAHFIHVSEGRDFTVPEGRVVDVGRAVEGDLCAHCGQPFTVSNGVEVGQVFKLGTKYAEALKAHYIDAQGKQQTMIMGCYGIGVSRTVAAVVESCHDDKGIVWPAGVAPFEAVVLPLNVSNAALMQAAEEIYKSLLAAGVDALLDDRDLRPGFKFKDAELIGFPVQVALGEKSLAQGQVEINVRATGEKRLVPAAGAADEVKKIVSALLAQAPEPTQWKQA